MKCPKCGYIRQPNDDDLVPEWQCPKCQIAYAKVQASLKSTDSIDKSTKSATSSSPSPRFLKKSRILLVGIAFLVVIGVLAWWIEHIQTATSHSPEVALTRSNSKAPLIVDKDKESDIRKVIAETEERLTKTEDDYAEYSGGLIKSVLGVTIAIQNQTLEMLKQKHDSWTFGIGLRYTVDGRPFEPPSATEESLTVLENEISETKRRIDENNAKATQYSGGLVRATLLSAVATGHQTLAMLEQRHAALRFGLPQYVGFKEQYLPSTSHPIVTETNLDVGKKDWDIVKIDSRITETNDSWWKYAWKLTLRSSGIKSHLFDATIEFQDEDGFVIDTDNAHNLLLNAGEEKDFTGYSLIRLPGARRVAKTYAKVHVQ